MGREEGEGCERNVIEGKFTFSNSLKGNYNGVGMKRLNQLVEFISERILQIEAIKGTIECSPLYHTP